MEFVDFLIKEKCGGPRPRTEIVVEVGQRWHCERFDGTTVEDVTVTAENLERMRAEVNDWYNDYDIEWMPVDFEPQWIIE